VVAGSRIDLARSGIGIAVRKGARKPDIGTPDALKHSLLAAKSVAHSKTGLSGIYFPTVLARLGIADAMKSKIVMPEPGNPVGEVVAKGDAEIGVQQISELLPVAGVEVVGPLPAELQRITTFTAGVLTAAKEPDTAKALVKFVAAESLSLLKGKGLEPA
jgi:molybdate transport system substrate-binding protein